MDPTSRYDHSEHRPEKGRIAARRDIWPAWCQQPQGCSEPAYADGSWPAPIGAGRIAARAPSRDQPVNVGLAGTGVAGGAVPGEGTVVGDGIVVETGGMLGFGTAEVVNSIAACDAEHNGD